MAKLAGTKAGRRRERAGHWLGMTGVLLSGAALMVEYGFGEASRQSGWLHLVQIVGVVLVWLGKLGAWLGTGEKRHWRRVVTDVALLVGLVVALGVSPRAGEEVSPSSIRWAAFHLYVLALVVIYAGRLALSAAAVSRSPARTLLFVFATLIFIGSILLMLPAAHVGARFGLTDAVFTATSATCVTGLVVRDTGSGFTLLGQTVILALIQAGGLGIMIFGSLFALLLGSRLSLRESVALRDVMQEQSSGRMGRLVLFIVAFTFLMEGLGALLMYPMWQGAHPQSGAAYNSIFHSISAYCNAGFGLEPDSLMNFRKAAPTYAVICPLIIIGGIGFPVLRNLGEVVLYRLRRRLGRAVGERPVHLSLHTRLVLITTVVLLVGGWGVLTVLELVRPGLDKPFWSAALDGGFLAVTSRTAGFNTVQTAGLGPATKLFIIVLMSIGGSPSSAAGGFKTITLAVLVLSIYTTIRRRQQVQFGRRAIPTMIVRRAATVVILYGSFFWLLVLLLSLTESVRGEWNALDLMFEVASALGTVGLSTINTGELTLPGKWVIIVGMYIGRLGPLSLLAALTMNVKAVRFHYPEEPVVVG